MHRPASSKLSFDTVKCTAGALQVLGHPNSCNMQLLAYYTEYYTVYFLLCKWLFYIGI